MAGPRNSSYSVPYPTRVHGVVHTRTYYHGRGTGRAIVGAIILVILAAVTLVSTLASMSAAALAIFTGATLGLFVLPLALLYARNKRRNTTEWASLGEERSVPAAGTSPADRAAMAHLQSGLTSLDSQMTAAERAAGLPAYKDLPPPAYGLPKYEEAAVNTANTFIPSAAATAGSASVTDVLPPSYAAATTPGFSGGPSGRHSPTSSPR